MKSSPGLNSLQVADLTLSANATLAVQEPVAIEAAEAWRSTHGCSLPQPLTDPGGSSSRLCARREDGVVAWKRCAVCLCGPALTQKHTHRHHTSMLRRVQPIRRDGRGKTSQDQRVNWLLSPEAEAIRVFRVPRSQSPASPRRPPPDPWTRSTPF